VDVSSDYDATYELHLYRQTLLPRAHSCFLASAVTCLRLIFVLSNAWWGPSYSLHRASRCSTCPRASPVIVLFAFPRSSRWAFLLRRLVVAPSSDLVPLRVSASASAHFSLLPAFLLYFPLSAFPPSPLSAHLSRFLAGVFACSLPSPQNSRPSWLASVLAYCPFLLPFVLGGFCPFPRSPTFLSPSLQVLVSFHSRASFPFFCAVVHGRVRPVALFFRFFHIFLVLPRFFSPGFVVPLFLRFPTSRSFARPRSIPVFPLVFR